MTTSPLVDLFADPIRARLRQLTVRAAITDHTRTELHDATVAVTRWRDQLHDRTATVTQHWHGKAAEQFAHRATGVGKTLTTAAEALAIADTVVVGALGDLRTGHATIQRLLDEYTGQGNQVVAAAMKLLDAGHPTALLDAANYLSTLSGRYVTEADAAVSRAKQTLLAATGQLGSLDKLLPEPKPKPKPKATHHTVHDDGGTTASSATQVHIGHGLGTVTAPNAKAATAVKAALSQLGVPYVWGGESPGHAFDCSGLTAWAYGKAGINLVHFASSQRVGKRVSEQDLKPGDLVIFSGHVTMYIGKGQVVAAPHTGTDVQIEPLFTSIPGDPFLGFYRPSVHA